LTTPEGVEVKPLSSFVSALNWQPLKE
jgi:hypothetical protein